MNNFVHFIIVGRKKTCTNKWKKSEKNVTRDERTITLTLLQCSNLFKIHSFIVPRLPCIRTIVVQSQ